MEIQRLLQLRIKELAFIASGSISNLSLSAAEELLKISQEAIQKV
jgi:hypothetical protein